MEVRRRGADRFNVREQQGILSPWDLRGRLVELGGLTTALAKATKAVQLEGGASEQKRQLVTQFEHYGNRAWTALSILNWEGWGDVRSSLFEKCFIETSSWNAVVMDLIAAMCSIRLLDWMFVGDLVIVLQVLSVPSVIHGVDVLRRWYIERRMFSRERELKGEIEGELNAKEGDEAKLAYLNGELRKVEVEVRALLVATQLGGKLSEVNGANGRQVDGELLSRYVDLNKDVYGFLEQGELAGQSYPVGNADLQQFKEEIMGKSWIWSPEKSLLARLGMMGVLVGVSWMEVEALQVLIGLVLGVPLAVYLGIKCVEVGAGG